VGADQDGDDAIHFAVRPDDAHLVVVGVAREERALVTPDRRREALGENRRALRAPERGRQADGAGPVTTPVRGSGDAEMLPANTPADIRSRPSKMSIFKRTIGGLHGV